MDSEEEEEEEERIKELKVGHVHCVDGKGILNLKIFCCLEVTHKLQTTIVKT